jgi:hypothetical protein
VAFAQTTDTPADVVAALRNGQAAEALSRIELHLPRQYDSAQVDFKRAADFEPGQPAASQK